MSDRPDSSREPTRDEVDQLSGPVLLEFGAEWCGYSQALRPQLTALLAQHPEVRHIRIEDGPGRPLGRSFKVKLWPNLVFMRDGRVVRQEARPDAATVAAGLAEITQEESARAAAPGENQQQSG
jgi:thioredoxin 1